MLFTKVLLDVGPSNKQLRRTSDPGAVGPLLKMFSGIGNARLVELLTNWRAFKNVTEDGYRWKRTALDGVFFEVRNLGGRRVRVEVRGGVIRDPLLFPLSQ